MCRHVKTVHADFKDDETVDDRENPDIIDDDASDKFKLVTMNQV